MNAEIIAVGSELLTPERLDTNSLFLTGALNSLGIGRNDRVAIVLPDGTAIPPRKGRLSTNLLNERGRWWIVASRLMIPANAVCDLATSRRFALKVLHEQFLRHPVIPKRSRLLYANKASCWDPPPDATVTSLYPDQAPCMP